MFLKPKKISSDFIIGCSRIIDIGASLNKTQVQGNNDIECIAGDWEIIGNDLYDSISAIRNANNLT